MYSSVEAVKRTTQVRYADLGFTNEAEMDTWLAERLDEITDYINTSRHRDYEAEVEAGERANVPAGIHRIALTAASNFIQWMQANKQGAVVRVGDFTVRQAPNEVFTAEVRKALGAYPAKRYVGFTVLDKVLYDELDEEATA